MGVFLSLSGVIGADSAAVERSMASYVLARGGTFHPDVATPEEPDVAVIAENGLRTSVLYPQHFFEWDDVSRYLSAELRVPVFSLHIHDGDLWMFILFDSGLEVTQFNPIPDYWEALDPRERARWLGDAEAVAARIPGIAPDSISGYFVEWDDATLGMEDSPKAYPDDEFSIGNCWQMIDFMRRIGLKYPLSENGPIDGVTYRLRLEQIDASD